MVTAWRVDLVPKFWREQVSWGTPEEQPPSLGERLEQLRKGYVDPETGKVGLTAVEAARRMKISQASLSDYESGEVMPIPPKAVHQIAAFYDVSPLELLQIEGKYLVWRRSQAPLPGTSIAIPHERVYVRIIDGLEALAAKGDDDEHLDSVADLLAALEALSPADIDQLAEQAAERAHAVHPPQARRRSTGA